jgi:hypothetical protein
MAPPGPVVARSSRAKARGDANERSDFDFLVIEDEVENRFAEEIRLRRVLRASAFRWT